MSRTLFDGISWRGRPETARDMSAVFAVVRRLHEMLWYLADAVDRAVTPDAAEDVEALRDRIRTTIDAGSSSLRRLDVDALHTEVRDLLVEVSQEVRTITRAGATPDTAFRPGVDLAGLDLRGGDLRGRDLRGASAIAADLRRVDLTDTDLLGVDLRDALVHGADLSAALFLTQSQVNAMSGDGATSLPRWIERPRHWSPSA
ncbi:pentapeptide repeat-containing protein [Curtobacterium oceanosedimentum]|uniref:pentapeptide repeat-containing protein n=1 Tax=Curtobacterium oceanosedimentum TaxID=465820 RepID=UPI0027DFD2A1|nr:pentapeptide repeat-containing protein [Curtobacterium oceanosedimentum]